MGDGTTRNM